MLTASDGDRAKAGIMVTVPVPTLRPMLASAAAQLPKGPAWSYEVKFDGYRTLALKDGSRVRLLSRNLKDATL
jgi:ATP-dependent DNA ligase